MCTVNLKIRNIHRLNLHMNGNSCKSPELCKIFKITIILEMAANSSSYTNTVYCSQTPRHNQSFGNSMLKV